MSFNPKPVKFPNKVTGKLRIGNTAADYGLYGTGTEQKFELGTRYRVDDRVYRYGKAGGDCNSKKGAQNNNVWFGENTVAASLVGDMYVTITTDSTSGSVTTGFGVANNMVGGFFSQPDNTNAQWRRIEGHVAAPTGTTVKVYLDGPLTRALPSGGAFAEWMHNPYSNLINNGGVRVPVMGVPTTSIASGSYGWFQTWGPTWVGQNAAADFGGTYDQMATWTEGGNIADANTNTNAQIAGYIVTKRAEGDWANPPFLFLTISP